MLNSKSYTYQSLRVKPLEISYSSVNFFSDRERSSSGRWGICSDWGVRNSPVRIAYTVRNMIALRYLILKIPTVAVLRASCPKISTHLTVILLKGIYVLSCRAAPEAINSRPLQPLAGWLLREKLTLVIWEHPILRGLWAKIIKWGKPKPKHLQTQSDWASLKRLILRGSDACYLWRLCFFQTVRRHGLEHPRGNCGSPSDRVCEGLEVTWILTTSDWTRSVWP